MLITRLRALPSWTVIVLLALTACGQAPQQRQEADAAGELAAAARTLEALHGGRLTEQYARGAFVNYGEQLVALDETSLPGDLRARWNAARPAVQRPCLEATCDWRGQVRALDEAAGAFRAAGGGG